MKQRVSLWDLDGKSDLNRFLMLLKLTFSILQKSIWLVFDQNFYQDPYPRHARTRTIRRHQNDHDLRRKARQNQQGRSVWGNQWIQKLCTVARRPVDCSANSSLGAKRRINHKSPAALVKSHPKCWEEQSEQIHEIDCSRALWCCISALIRRSSCFRFKAERLNGFARWKPEVSPIRVSFSAPVELSGSARWLRTLSSIFLRNEVGRFCVWDEKSVQNRDVTSHSCVTQFRFRSFVQTRKKTYPLHVILFFLRHLLQLHESIQSSDRDRSVRLFWWLKKDKIGKYEILKFAIFENRSTTNHTAWTMGVNVHSFISSASSFLQLAKWWLVMDFEKFPRLFFDKT